ncbi:MAG TPA: hypothetical protein VK604_06880 [Bryobacteraceae bacterium]|nr:hypothetical protein [Bryobacteraceae bacterium]
MWAGFRRILIWCLVTLGLTTFLLFACTVIVPEWRYHFFKLLSRSWDSFAEAEGSSTLGLVSNWIYTLLVFGITLLIIWSSHGWKAVMQHWQKEIVTALRVAIVVSLLVYGPVFVWQAIKTVFNDHAQLIAANAKLRLVNSALVDPKTRDGEIFRLKQEIADLRKGRSPIPTQYPSAQSPPQDPLAIIRIASQKQVASADADLPYGLEIVLTTSKDISPTAMKIIFSGPVGRMYGHPPGQIYSEAQGGILASDRRAILVQWQSPPFSVTEPVVITVYSKSHVDPQKVESLPFNFPYPVGYLVNQTN